MKEKFIYCTDEKIANKLIKETDLIVNKMINGVNTWVFENNNKVKFNKNVDINTVKFTNKFYL